jgi:hypothetical protein
MRTVLLLIQVLFWMTRGMVIMRDSPIVFQPAPVAPSFEFICNNDNKLYECQPMGRVIALVDDDYVIFDDECQACSYEYVDSFTRFSRCPKKDDRRCTDFTQPICARLDNGELKEFASECEACRSNADEYIVRGCPS